MKIVTTAMLILVAIVVSGCGALSVTLAQKDTAQLQVYPGPCSILDMEKHATRNFEYNEQKRVSKMSGRGFTAEFEYDEKGNIISKKISNRMVDATFYYTWDEFNNVTQVRYVPVSDLDNALQYQLDLEYQGVPGIANVVAAVDYEKDGFPNAHFFETRFNIALLALDSDMSVQKKIRHDPLSRLEVIEVRRVNGEGAGCEPAVSKVAYNELGLVEKIEQTNGMYPDHPDIKEFRYDSLNRPIMIVDSTFGDGNYYRKKIEHVYDEAGNTISVREFEAGNTIRFEKYDYTCWLSR